MTPVEEGWVDVGEQGDRVRWWRHGTGSETLLVLHGGPGAGSKYLEPLSALGDEELSVVFFDQLGAGTSSRPDDPALWRIERSVHEVEQVRDGLGLDAVHLLGQSFGGFLALEYALAHPERVRSLVLSNTAASAVDTVRHMHALRAELSPSDYATLVRHEAAGTLEDEDYQAVVRTLYAKHLRRSHPYEPERSSREYEQVAAPLLEEFGPAYVEMWGVNEFFCTGNLLSWDVTDRLGEIAAPTLVTCGLHDHLGVPLHRTLADGIPETEFVIFGNSSHMPFLERDAAAYLDTVRGFLARAGR